MLSIPLTTLGSDYVTIFSGETGYKSGFLQVYNGLAELLLQTGPGQGQFVEASPVPAPPGIFNLAAGDPGGVRRGDLIFGLQARQYPNTTPTDPVRILGAVYRPGDAQLVPGSAITQTLSATGDVAGGGGGSVTGQIVMYGGTVPPTGWLLCDGSAVSRTDFAALFSAIGIAYGSGDGATTFNIPDLRGRVPVGLGTNATVNLLGNNDGVVVGSRRGTKHRHTPHGHTVTDPGHVHNVSDPGHGHNVNDPTHAHTVTIFNQPGASVANINGNNNGGVYQTATTSAELTGITIASGSTGVTIVSHATGVTLASADGGSGTGSDPLDGAAYQVVNYIIQT